MRCGAPPAGPRGRLRQLIIAWGAVLLLIGSLVVGVEAWLTFDSRPTLALRPGRARIRVEGAWFNRAPEIVLGPVWMQRLYPLTPGLREKWGWETHPSRAAPGLIVTFMDSWVQDASSGDYACDLLDQHGCRFRNTGGDGRSFGEEHTLSECDFEFAPRDESLFRLRMRDGNEPSWLPPDLPIHVTPTNQISTWLPEELPRLRQANGFAARLHSCELVDTPGEPPRCRLRFDGLKGWRPISAVVRDCWGAVWSEDPTAPPASQAALDLPLGLCRSGVYRVKVEFTRALDPSATSGNHWTCSIPVPNQGGYRKMKVGDKTIEILNSGAPGQPYLNVSLFQRKHARRLRAFVRPSVLVPVPDDGMPRPAILLARPVPSSLRRLELTVDEFQSRYLTWTVRPTVATASPNSSLAVGR
jgi:hypothetical protein